jgi:predicted AlkP superfamily phosphohydrolase/phosphomutase
MNRDRVLVIGLDGGTFEVIKPLVAEGRLPNLGRLMAEGVHGILQSTIPPVTAVAWTTFMTGKNPGKHGIFHFHLPSTTTYKRPLVNATSIKAKPLWDIISERGKRVGVVNVPLTYPPHPVNGVMVAGMLTPSEKSEFTYPPTLHTELIREIGDYPLEARAIGAFCRNDPIESVRQFYLLLDRTKRTSLHLMDREPWDFFMLVFRGTDLIQHQVWRLKDRSYCEQHPDEAQKYGKVLDQYYEAVDRAVGEILERTDSRTTVIIMSDHGAGPVSRLFYVNKWLVDEGYLTLRRFSGMVRALPRPRRRTLGPLLTYLRLGLIAHLLPRSWQDRKVWWPVKVKPQRWRLIDWSRTRAQGNLTGDEPVIIINLKGREPQGIVEPGDEYERLREEIAQRLLALWDPEANDRVIERVYRREEIYHGSYVDQAPDLEFITRGLLYRTRGKLDVRDALETPVNLSPSMHREEGIFIMRGPGVKSGIEIGTTRLMDLAPSILYLLGGEVPEDMDGRVVEEAFREGVLHHRPIRYGPPVDWEPAGTGERQVFSTEEARNVEESLRGLGYVD